MIGERITILIVTVTVVGALLALCLAAFATGTRITADWNKVRIERAKVCQEAVPEQRIACLIQASR